MLRRRKCTQGPYKIKSQVSLVVLHASVLNDRSVFVPGLKEDNFRVLEDKVEQKLSVFKQEDVPVSFGLVVDNSGSMRDKRPQVNAAALTFVKTSNPQDEGFVVNFNDDYYLDTEHDFTSDLDEMKTALERIDARGSTALYDAVIGSLDHLKKGHARQESDCWSSPTARTTPAGTAWKTPSSRRSETMP
jgi:Ca-activated chloride channel homolog